MNEILIYKHNRTILNKIKKRFNIRAIEFEILTIIFSANNYCNALTLRKYIPKSINRYDFYTSISHLNNIGLIDKRGEKRPFNLSLTGSGEFVLNEYRKALKKALKEEIEESN